MADPQTRAGRALLDDIFHDPYLREEGASERIAAIEAEARAAALEEARGLILARLAAVGPLHRHAEHALCVPAWCPAGALGMASDSVRTAIDRLAGGTGGGS